MQSDLGSIESTFVAWQALSGVPFVQRIQRTVEQLNESRYEWSWLKRQTAVCATPMSNQKAPDVHGKDDEAC